MGLKSDEVGYFLQDMGIIDPDPSMSKWRRLFNSLALAQNKFQVGNHLIMFINRAMNPVRYVNAQQQSLKSSIVAVIALQMETELSEQKPYCIS